MSNAAFFDLDGTIVDCVTEIEFLKYYSRKEYNIFHNIMVGFLTGIELVKYKLNIGKIYSNYSDFKKRNTQWVFTNLNVDKVDQNFNELFNAKLVKKVFSQATNLISSFNEAKIPVYLITSSYDFISEYFCRYLSIKNYYAANMEIGEDHSYTGILTSSIPYGPEKATIIKRIAKKEQIDLATSFAYGDKFSDRFMLESVGKPTAINPDKRLRKKAEENNWSILEWN